MALTIGVLFLGVTVWTGCGGAAEPEQAAPLPPTDPASVAPPSPPPSETPSAAPASSPTTGASALAVEEHESGVEVALLRVRRASGETLNVHWRYSNRTQETKTLFTGSGSWYTPYKLAADVYIIDNVNQKKHLVVEANDIPVTSTTTHDYGDLSLDAGGMITSWAKFPAPPANVETISVYIPGLSPIEDILISD